MNNPFVMSKISDDAIISVYLHMLDKTQADLKLPEYSEIYLRVALKVVCGKHFVLSPDIMELCRKVLALYYCEEYPFLTSVLAIMERCFSREELHSIIAEKDHVLGKWDEFKNGIKK